MDEFILLLKEYVAQNKKLIEYINNLQRKEKKYYRDNQEILYVGIVNRTYSLWETFCKDIIFEYYQRIKDKLLERGELVHKLKLNELPGYIVEEGVIFENRISYEIKRDFITYTSKNIGYDELKNLFSRFDINVEELKANKRIVDYLNENNYFFGIDDRGKDNLKTAMKNLTDERNKVSHYSSIYDYQDLNIIISWAEFCQVLARELTSIIIKNVIINMENNLIRLGNYVKYLNSKHVLCIDVLDGVTADLNSIIYTKKDDKILNVYKPLSFMVNDKAVDEINEYDNAGIMLEPFVETKTTITENDEIYVIIDGNKI